MSTHGTVSRGLRLAVYTTVVVLFVGIVAARGGPSLGDSYGVVRPTTSLSHGDLAGAARASVLPQPPGYAVMAAPFVAALRPFLGVPVWCDNSVPPVARPLLTACHPAQQAAHRWYRSQALLAVLAWLALVAGCVRLLRAAGAGFGRAELLLVALLAVTPAMTDGVVLTFHPQDLLCVGLIAAGVAEALQGRWALSGVAFGAAFTCKQFALLALLPVLAAAPGWRERLRVLAPAAAVVALVLVPFFIADPSGTLRALGAVDAGGAHTITGGTLLGKAALSASAKLLIARDGPIALAAVMCLWARWRLREALAAPVALIGLVVACLAARLVGEVWFSGYYLVAVSAMLIVLDLAARRPPIRSLVWITVTSVLVETSGGLPTSDGGALVSMAAALGAVVIGLAELRPALVPGPAPRTAATSPVTECLRPSSLWFDEPIARDR